MRSSRRALLLALATEAGAAAVATATASSAAAAPAGGPGRAASQRAEEPFEATVARLLADATPRVGRIEIDLPQVAESGNSVPLKVQVDSPMTAADHVQLIHIVAERNPRPWVASFTLGPRAGRAALETYIRLSDTQAVAVFAKMADGAWWTQRREVTVTIGACDALGARY